MRDEGFYCWDSFHRELEHVQAQSAKHAAETFSLKNRTSAGYVVRVVREADVRHFEIRAEPIG